MINLEARDWLPPGAMAGSSVHTSVSSVVDIWAKRWFVSGDVGLLKIEQREGNVLGATATARVEAKANRDGVRLALTTEGSDAVYRYALGRGPDDVVGEADKPVLDAFVQRVTDDLLVEFDSLLGFQTESNREEFKHVVSLKIGDRNARTILTISLSSNAAKQLLKSALRTVSPPEAYAPRPGVFDTVEIPIELRFGEIQLTPQSVRNLAVGDVIQLDRLIDDGVDIAMVGAKARFACAGLSDDVSPQIIFRRYG